MLLRRYHKKKEVAIEVETPTIGEDFIEDIDLAHELAIYDDYSRTLERERIEDIDLAHELAAIENNIIALEGKKVEELKDLAKDAGIEGYSKMKKEELITALAGD